MVTVSNFKVVTYQLTKSKTMLMKIIHRNVRINRLRTIINLKSQYMQYFYIIHLMSLSVPQTTQRRIIQ